MKTPKKFIFLLSFMTVLLANAAPDTLPEGISSPMINYGVYLNLDQRFENDGQLWKLGDLRSIEYDAVTLAKANSEAKDLITALNAFGQRHGQYINYGTLKFEINPSLQYTAPIYAYGIFSNWTVAVAAPVLTYSTDISIQNINSNLESYKVVYQGRVSDELDRALNLDIKDETIKTLQQRGYKPLENKKAQFLADVQIVSIYRVYRNIDWELYYISQLGLPTGPKYDPDDLLALNSFGQATSENTLAMTYNTGYALKLTPSLGYRYVLPDTITARVPIDEDDDLPDASQKQQVQRRIGAKWIYKGEVELKLTDSVALNGSYTQASKSDDTYSGSNRSRYDLLSKNTYTREEYYGLKFNFSTVKYYFRKQIIFPFILSYEFSDLFRGENVNRKSLHEFNFKMFF